MSDQNTSAVFSPISLLRKSNTVYVQDNEDIADVLLDTFFPPLPEYVSPAILDLPDYH